ncbi:hypothetical protein PLESTM_001365300 [Pleodorina starrii]|nr:hypothetical protein PLESTM_001365300 [Pleodorina starrii]
MLAFGAARLLSGFALSTCSLAASSSSSSAGRAATLGAAELLRGYCGAWKQSSWTHPSTLAAGPGPSITALGGFSTRAPGSPEPPTSGSNAPPAHATSPASTLSPASTSATGAPTHETPQAAPASADASPSSDAEAPAAAAAAAPSGPASRRDKSASADVVYPSSRDDNLGVQRNWFNALFTQLQVMQRTGLMAPHLKGRQKEVFEAVEREFEGLWERHVRGRGLEGTAHRGMLLCCLAVATHKVLLYETGDDTLVREVVRTNLGGTAVGIMMRLHKTRLWLLLRLLAEDPYKQAVRFLPSLQGDLGSLVAGEVATGEEGQEGGIRGGATWTARSCAFHSVLAAEGASELLPEFCCQFSMQWLEVFAQYGVRVGLEESLGFGDERCVVRISRPAPPGRPRPPGPSA